MADEVAQLRGRRRELLAERFTRAKAEGELPSDTDAEAPAMLYMAVLQGMALQARDGASETCLKNAVKIAMDAWPDRQSARALMP